MTTREKFGWIGWIVAGIVLICSGIFLTNRSMEYKYIPVVVKTVKKIAIPPDTISIEKLSPVRIDTTLVIKYRTRLDSASIDSIIRDYFAVKTYEQVFKDDTSAFIKVTDHVFKNSILKSNLVYENRIGYTTITLEKTIKPKKYSILAGATLCNHMYFNAGLRVDSHTFLLGTNLNGLQVTYLKSLYSW